MTRQMVWREYSYPFDRAIAARRRCPRDGKRILFVAGGHPEHLPDYQRFQQQGRKMVMLDCPDHWAKSCVDSGLFETFIGVNLDERESLFDEILAARLGYAMGLANDFGGEFLCGGFE